MSLYNLAAELQRAVGANSGAEWTDEQVQQLLRAAVRLYFMKLEENPHLLPFGGDPSVTATEVAAVVSKMLQETNLAVFELAMWQMMGRY
jgi:hypothetical protein